MQSSMRQPRAVDAARAGCRATGGQHRRALGRTVRLSPETFMHASAASALAVLLLAGAGSTNAAPTTDEAIDAAVRGAQSRFGIPGISVVVMLGDRIVYEKGFGLADVASRAPAGARTVYPIGSISKQFTAAGVLKLAGDGKLALADPVAKRVPEYWPHGSEATLEHLLRHTSGVREFFSVPAAAKLIDDPRGTIDDVMALVAREPLVFPSGSRWSYSNSGYHLAARTIEKATGQPYERYLESAFFAPFGLRSLHHCKAAPVPPQEATGYGRRRGVTVVAPWENMATARGDGGLCGNAVDLARWTRLLARGDAIAPAAVERMTAPTKTSAGWIAPYGMALGLLPLDGRPRFSHTGAIGGFSAAAAHYPRDGLAIAVLTNLALVPVEAIERDIARAVLGLRAPRMQDLPVPRELRGRLVGRWEIGVPGFVIDIAPAGDRLRVRMPAPGWSGDLRYQGGGRFAADRAPDVEYVLAADGATADTLVIGMGDMHWDARRVPERAAAH
jgi:CubicO group peptidase (beta-lactamase class C family)